MKQSPPQELSAVFRSIAAASAEHRILVERRGRLAVQRHSALIEREIKYFTPLELLRQHVHLPSCPKQQIVQRYFHPELAVLLAPFICELAGHSDLIGHYSATQVRLRYDRDMESAFLQTKLRHPNGAAEERLEVSTQICSALLKHLIPLAQAGTLEKTRYHVPGKVFRTSGKAWSVMAEVDVLTAINSRRIAVDEIGRSFATIDVELPSWHALQAIRRGSHDFAFLKTAVDLQRAPKNLRRTLSNRRIAKEGLNVAALKELRRSCFQANQ